MIFEKLMLKDFLSLGEVDVPLAKQGLVLLEGQNKDDPTAESNGSGKSAICDGLLWTLYGVTSRGAAADEVLRRGAKQVWGAVNWRDDKGALWMVERSRPSKIGLKLVCNGKDLTLGHSRDTQVLIDGALGLDAKAFMQAVLFGQSQLAMFAGLTDRDQKDVLERIIGLGDLTDALKAAKAEVAGYEAKLAEVEIRMGSREGRIVSLKESRKTYEADALKWEEEHEATIERLRKDLAGAGPEKPVPVSHAEAVLKTVTEACEKALQASASASQDFGIESSRAGNLSDEIAKLETKLKRTKALSPGTRCDKCGSNLSKLDLDAHLADIEEEIAKAKKAHAAARRKMDEALEARNEANKGVKEAQKERDLASADLNNAKQKDREVKRLFAELEVVKKDTNTAAERAEECKKRLAVLTAEHAKDEAEETALSEAKAYAEFWVEGFSNAGLKSFMLDGVTPLINKRASYYASILTKGSVSVEVSTQTVLKSGEARERMEVRAINEHGAEFYIGNSAGERRKIDLALGAALQDLAATRAKSPVDLRLYDEIFDALDPTAGEYAMDFLLEQKKRAGTIIVISHRSEFKSSFPHVWTVRKEDGVSTLSTK